MPVAVHGAVGAKNMMRKRKEKMKKKESFHLSSSSETKVHDALENLEQIRARVRHNSVYKDPDRYDNKLLVGYIHLSHICETITVGDKFNAFIIGVIIIAGALVGLQTYPMFEGDPYVGMVDNVVLIIFGIEVIAKIVAEGLAPWRYFTGNEWRWNNFDFVIVVMCMPTWGSTFGGNSVALLRLVRLMRVMKLVKKVPQLQMIVMGLIGGMKSIGYIMALLFLVFYLYGVLGVYTFRDNDPFHFRDLFTALNTLFRVSTLEDWTDVLYINYYGCNSDSFPSGIYKDPTDPNTLFITCDPNSANGSPGVAVSYFVTFVIVSALVMLSLFVGAVTMSMTESMEQMKQEAEENEKRKRLIKAKKRAEEQRRREIEEGDYSDSDSEVEKPDPSEQKPTRKTAKRGTTDHMENVLNSLDTTVLAFPNGARKSLRSVESDQVPKNVMHVSKTRTDERHSQQMESSQGDEMNPTKGGTRSYTERKSAFSEDFTYTDPRVQSAPYRDTLVLDNRVTGSLAAQPGEVDEQVKLVYKGLDDRTSVGSPELHDTALNATDDECNDTLVEDDDDVVAQVDDTNVVRRVSLSKNSTPTEPRRVTRKTISVPSKTQGTKERKSSVNSTDLAVLVTVAEADQNEDASKNNPQSPVARLTKSLSSRFLGTSARNLTQSVGSPKIFQRIQNSFSPHRDLDSHERLLLHHENSKFGDANTKRRIKHFMATAWDGVNLLDLIDDVEEQAYRRKWMRSWLMVSRMCANITEDSRFVNVITMIIVLAGLQVGAQTFRSMNEGIMGDILGITDQLILGTFIVEVILKTMAKEFKPWQYFYNRRTGFQGWNTFDYLVVAGSFLPDGEMITMLRLLRLLRVLKLVKSLPELQIIVVALIGGISSISYIGVIMFLVFYVFAILGMLLFSSNDPWHFGSLHISLVTLFRCATLEDWTDVMYINMYGCDRHGYFEMEDLCTNPHAAFTLAAMYFVIFTVIGALVLMTLFIGVVTTSMEEATAAQQEQMELQARVRAVQEKFGLDDRTIQKYEQVFHILDLDGGGTIEEEELRIGLQSIGQVPSSKQLRCMLKAVDADDSGEVDIAEFVLFMCLLKEGNFKDQGILLNDISTTMPVTRVNNRARPSVMKTLRQSTRNLLFGSVGRSRRYLSWGSTSQKVAPQLPETADPVIVEGNEEEDGAHSENAIHEVTPVRAVSNRFNQDSESTSHSFRQANVEVEPTVSHLAPLSLATSKPKMDIDKKLAPRMTALDQTKRRVSLQQSLAYEVLPSNGTEGQSGREEMKLENF